MKNEKVDLAELALANLRDFERSIAAPAGEERFPSDVAQLADLQLHLGILVELRRIAVALEHANARESAFVTAAWAEEAA